MLFLTRLSPFVQHDLYVQEPAALSQLFPALIAAAPHGLPVSTYYLLYYLPQMDYLSLSHSPDECPQAAQYPLFLLRKYLHHLQKVLSYSLQQPSAD